MFLHHRSNIDQQKLLFYHLINKKPKNSKTWKHQPSDSVMFLCSRVSRVKGTRQGHRRLEIQLRTPQKQLRKKNHKTSATKLYTQYSVIFLKAGAHTSFFFQNCKFQSLHLYRVGVWNTRGRCRTSQARITTNLEDSIQTLSHGTDRPLETPTRSRARMM